jgi:hypothetical protein
MNTLKQVLAEESYQRKMDDLRQQLSSNSTLWKQLAAIEKREKMLELQLKEAERQVGGQDRIIERLRDDLKKEKREC